jgi:hypothetical protein
MDTYVGEERKRRGRNCRKYLKRGSLRKALLHELKHMTIS